MIHSQYLKSSFPTLKTKRLTYSETARVCHQAGWRGEDLVVSIAVTRAESAGDPLAYLSYLSVPGSPTSKLPWERRAYATNLAWLGTIDLYPGPTVEELAETLAQRKLNTWKPWLHIGWPLVGPNGELRPQCDFGLFQLNSRFLPITPDPLENAKIAFGMWKSRGWQPWVAHQKGNHQKYMGPARVAVKTL